MPTTATSTFEPATNRLDPVFHPELAFVLNVALLAPSAGTTVYSKGQILAEYSATASKGVYDRYNSLSTGNGLSVPKGILQYTVTVDSSSNVALAGEFGQTQKGAPMYMPGGAVWNAADLTGLDANAVTVMGGAFIEGSIANGGLIRL